MVKNQHEKTKTSMRDTNKDEKDLTSDLPNQITRIE